jgi:hypothetical protein
MPALVQRCWEILASLFPLQINQTAESGRRQYLYVDRLAVEA